MALIKWSPREAVPSLFERFDRDLDRLESFFFRDLPRGVRGVDFAPEVDLVDRKDEFLVVANVPGFSKQELEIHVSAHRLDLRGCHTEEKKEEEDGGYVCQERSTGCFARSLELPMEIRADDASAEMKDGVLTLHLPKAGPASSMKRIEVQDH